MEKYRQEMMKLYGKSTSKNDTVPVQEKIQETAPSDNENITENEIPQIQETPSPEVSDIDERYLLLKMHQLLLHLWIMEILFLRRQVLLMKAVR